MATLTQSGIDHSRRLVPQVADDWGQKKEHLFRSPHDPVGISAMSTSDTTGERTCPGHGEPAFILHPVRHSTDIVSDFIDAPLCVMLCPLCYIVRRVMREPGARQGRGMSWTGRSLN